MVNVPGLQLRVSCANVFDEIIYHESITVLKILIQFHLIG